MAIIPGPVKEPRVTTTQIVQEAQPLLPEAALPASIIGQHRLISFREELGSFVGGLAEDSVFIVDSVIPTSAQILLNFQPPSAIRLSDGVRITPALLPEVTIDNAFFGEIRVPDVEVTVSPSAGTVTIDKDFEPEYTIVSGTTGTYSRLLHLEATFTGVGPVDGDTLAIFNGTDTDTYEFDDDASVGGGNILVDIDTLTTAAQKASALAAVINTEILSGGAALVNDIRVILLNGAVNVTLQSLSTDTVSASSSPASIDTIQVRLFGDTNIDFFAQGVATGDQIDLSDNNSFLVEIPLNDVQLFVSDILPTTLVALSQSVDGTESYGVVKTLSGSDATGIIRITLAADRTDRGTEIISVDDNTFDVELGGDTANPISPLSLAVKLALRNTSQQVQAIQLSADTIAGHRAAIDVLANFVTPYGLAPLTALEQALTEWKAHAVEMSAEGENGERVLWRQGRLVVQANKVADLTQWDTPTLALPTITFPVTSGGDNDEFGTVVIGDLVANLSTGDSARIVAITPGATAIDPYVVTVAQPNALVGNLIVTFDAGASGVPVVGATITISDGVDTDIYEFTAGGGVTTAGNIEVDVSGDSDGSDSAATWDTEITAEGTVTLNQTVAANIVSFDTFTNNRIVTMVESGDSGAAYVITGEAWNNWVVQTQALTKDEQATAIAQASADLDCRRVMNIWPDEIQVLFSDKTAGPTAQVGEGIWGGGDFIWEDAPGYFLAGIFAALRSQTSTGLPLAGRQAVGVFNLEKVTPFFTRQQLKRILSTGTWLVTQATPNGGTIRALRGVTTDDSTITTVEEMVTAAVDEFAKSIRAATSGLFDGSRVLDAQGNFLQDFSIGVQSVIDRFLDPTNARAKNITIITTFEDPNEAGTVIMDVDFIHLVPANSGKVRIFVRAGQTNFSERV